MPPSGILRIITADKFRKDVLSAVGPLVVLFDASWCPFCREFKPIMERYEGDLPWPVVAVSLDDMDDPLWDRYEIEVVPTIAVFERGQIVFRIDGTLGVGLGQNDVARLQAYAKGMRDGG